MGNECNNFNKENYSRPQIAKVIKDNFKDRDIRMLELLGDGTGVDYYIETLKPRRVDAFEIDKKRYKEYMHKQKPIFNEDDYIIFKRNDTTVCVTRGNLLDEFDLNDEVYNVVNLDFCTYFRRTLNSNSPVIIIDSMFANGKIEDNGLVFFTFQLTGIGVNWASDAIKNHDEIFEAVCEVARAHGYSLEEVFYYQYKSGKPTWMCNLGVKVTKNEQA